MSKNGPIGIFDSGYGGLTVFKEIKKQLPAYDFVYMGDNARVPYGTRSYETVLEYTWQCVDYLLGEKDCPLVILACNTASAKALRTIQQNYLKHHYPDRKVLGVIRPTTESIGHYTHTGHIGIFATNGTVQSETYPIEIHNFFPKLKVYQKACPMWVTLVENNEHLDEGADYFVKKYIYELLTQNNQIDTIVLACTHYPLLIEKIRKYLPSNIQIISQGPIVASSLVNYFQRHTDLNAEIVKQSHVEYLTTDNPVVFDDKASIFIDQQIQSSAIRF
jgi:glutamate racemase